MTKVCITLNDGDETITLTKVLKDRSQISSTILDLRATVLDLFVGLDHTYTFVALNDGLAIYRDGDELIGNATVIED